MASKSFLELFRRSNTAFPAIEGSLVVGKVLRVQRSGFVAVDVGFRTPQTLPATELGAKQLSPGDTHTFFLEALETPLGDMELDAKRMDATHKDEAIWNEILSAYRKNSVVKGRILNSVNAGFAVGIAGLVAFLPLSRVVGEVRVGQLHDFKILSTIQDTKNVVVSCVNQGDLDAILRSRARLAGATAASEALFQQYSATRSVPRFQQQQKRSYDVDTGALLARVKAMREQKEAMNEGETKPAVEGTLPAAVASRTTPTKAAAKTSGQPSAGRANNKAKAVSKAAAEKAASTDSTVAVPVAAARRKVVAVPAVAAAGGKAAEEVGQLKQKEGSSKKRSGKGRAKGGKAAAQKAPPA